MYKVISFNGMNHSIDIKIVKKKNYLYRANIFIKKYGKTKL